MKSQASHSLEETRKIAQNWLGEVTSKYKDSDKALVVGLSGHLGSGKTAFVKIIAEILGAKEDVTSPTFVIMKIYNTPNPKWKKLVHIDAYRLEGEEELEILKLDNISSDPNALIMIEWPENVGYRDFQDLAHLTFEATEKVHTIKIS